MGRLVSIGIALWGGAIHVDAIKSPPSDLADRLGMEGTHVPRQAERLTVGNALDQVGQQELDLENNYARYMNECANDKEFMHDMKYLRHTAPVMRLRKVMSDLKGPAMLLTSTSNMNCYVDNFISNLAKSNISTTVLVMNVDKEAQLFCDKRQARMRLAEPNIVTECVFLSHWIDDGKKFQNEGQKIYHRGLSFDSCKYIKVTWAKPALLYHAAKLSSYPVMMIDSDIIVHGDVFDWIAKNKNPGARIITGDDGGTRHDRPNTGITYIDNSYPDSTTLDLLEAWLNHAGLESVITSGRGEQESVAATINATGHPEYLQLIPQDIVGQCGKTISDHQVATHYNCITKKTIVLIEHDRWYPTDENCQPEAFAKLTGKNW